MDLQTRKIVFVQKFLKLKNEQFVARLEKLLETIQEEELQPMTIEELHRRIQISEADFDNGDYISSAELLKKYK